MLAATATVQCQCFSLSRIASTIPCSANTEPTDRSIPPVMMISPSPIEKMPYMPISRAMFVKLAAPRNRGFKIAVVAHNATNRIIMPSSFFTPPFVRPPDS